MKRHISKYISVFVIISLLMDPACYALATLPASQNGAAKRDITLELLTRTYLRYAEDEYEKKLLADNLSEAVLLSSGDFLVSEKYKIDKYNVKLLRLVIHEEIEAIMQILARSKGSIKKTEDRYRYAAIKDFILKYFPPESSNELPIELYVNHTVARAFEWIILLRNSLVLEKEISQEDKKFIGRIKKMIEEQGHLFKSEFWDSSERKRLIREAVGNGMIFYQTAHTEGEPDSEKGVIEEPLRENKPKVPPKTIQYYTQATKRYMRNIMKDLLLKKNVLLVGERGTGKNSIIYELAHRLNQPVEVLSLNEETAVRDLTQRMVLVDGRTEWVPSGVVEAMEYGRWLILDEIDRAPPGVLSVLNNLLQFKEITLPDGRRIKAHEDFRVIALMNPPTAAYAGGELSSELEDRFLL
ncbi:MAG: AAA family ATPase, partial [Candidatus Omnitrophota bacterium]